MVMLVTLAQASEHLRRDTTDDDSDLQLKIVGASVAIQNYLKNPLLAYELAKDEYGAPLLDSAGDQYLATDSSGGYIVRQEVQAAVLIVIGILYTDRTGDAYNKGDYEARLGNMSLPKIVHWLLDPLRIPTLA